MENSLLQLFPERARPFWGETATRQEELREIRLRINRPIIIYDSLGEGYLTKDGRRTVQLEQARCATERELKELLEHVCGYSMYAYERELQQGFLTVSGGHRVGVAGQVVMDDNGGIKTMKYISFLNIRVAHEMKGIGEKAAAYLYEDRSIKNTLIISPPGAGKTTLLRDLIRLISDGNPYGEGCTVGVIDERSELSGAVQGKPQKDLGSRTDILVGCPKYKGMQLLLRSMAPRVIAVDEMGDGADMEGMRRASFCGCRLLATVHGDSMEDVTGRFGLGTEIWKSLFQRIVILERRGKCFLVREIRGLEGEEYIRICESLVLS